jgi:molecular chaperone GrpE
MILVDQPAPDRVGGEGRTSHRNIERRLGLPLANHLRVELTLQTPSATIQTLHDGVELTLKNLQAAFDKAQISEINPLNEKYDPHRHQAMTMLESDQPAGTVVQVFQKGYLLNDRVLRPALVAVAKAREDPASGPAGA